MDRVTARVLRYDPSQDEKPRYETFEVPYEKDMRILDVLIYIQENYDNSLAFRYSCRRRRCGTCSVLANGKPVLSCMEGVESDMTIEPLPNLPIVRDLVVDTQEYEKRIISIHPYMERSRMPEEEPETLDPWEFLSLRPLQTCIECYSCMSACPVIDVRGQGFSGPTTLVQLARRALDPRDDSDRTPVALTEGGLVHCVSCYCCVNVCPLEINVLEGAIERLRGQCADQKVGNWAKYNQAFTDLVGENGIVNPLILMRRASNVPEILKNILIGFQFFLKGKISLRKKRVRSIEEIRKIYDATGASK
jgi:succinate dehydrogenase/fumarate reductase iron-sulfur protein